MKFRLNPIYQRITRYLGFWLCQEVVIKCFLLPAQGNPDWSCFTSTHARTLCLAASEGEGVDKRLKASNPVVVLLGPFHLHLAPLTLLLPLTHHSGKEKVDCVPQVDRVRFLLSGHNQNPLLDGPQSNQGAQLIR